MGSHNPLWQLWSSQGCQSSSLLPTTCRFIYRAPQLVLLPNTYICCSRESLIRVIHVRSIVTRHRHQPLPQSPLINSYCESDMTRSSKGQVGASPFVPSYTIMNLTPVLHSFSWKPPPPNSQHNTLSLNSTLPRLAMANVSSEFSQASCTTPPPGIDLRSYHEAQVMLRALCTGFSPSQREILPCQT